jgi:sugar transferase (PEP-CTERM system associated)
MPRIWRHYVPWSVLAVASADVVVACVALQAGVVLRHLRLAVLALQGLTESSAQVAFIAVSLVVLYVGDMYDLTAQEGRKACLIRAGGCAIAAAIAMATFGFLLPDVQLGRVQLAGAILVWWIGVTAVRMAWLHLAGAPHFQKRVLLLGATAVADALVTEIERRRTQAYKVLGYLDDRSAARIHLTNGFRVLAPMRELSQVARSRGANTVVVTVPTQGERIPVEQILDCKLRGISVEEWPTFYEKLTGKLLIEHLRPAWLALSDGFRQTRLTRTAKRLLDVVTSATVLLLSAPLLALVALLVKLDSTGPALFRQERMGERGRVFTLLKFRTMRRDAEAATGPMWAQEDDPRVTRVGRWLRKSRLDELPQMWNVLRGEMSLVGPRPERPHFVAQLQEKIPFYAQRLLAKPGITGWAQVQYRYGASLEDALEKLRYDLYYIKNHSLLLDLLILLSTVQVVLFGRGAR